MGITNGGLISSSSKTAQQDTLALSDGLACFTGSFSGVTSTSISHGLNSTDLVVEFKDSLGNLLIPDNWSITNPNVIEAEFSPAATGDVTIIACIESGLAPITGGVLILEGLSGIIDLDSPNSSIDISTSGQVINLNAIFTPASGALLEQKCSDIVTLSGLISSAASGTTINDLSGQLQLVSPNDGIVISESGQTIFISGLFTSASGAIIDQKCEDILTLSGLIGTGAGGSGVSVELFFTPASGTNFVLEHALGTDVFTWDMWSTEFDPIQIIQPTNVHPSGNDHVAIEIDLPASGRLVLTAGGAGPSGEAGVAGAAGADGPAGPPGPAGSGASTELFFTPLSGTLFVLEHTLNTDVFTWDMWSTEFDPILSIQPTTVSPSGNNHVIVELDLSASGRLVLTAGGTGPTGPSGEAGPQGPEGPEGPAGSGASDELFFTPLSGTLFVLEHDVNSSVFTWDMWSTEFDPILTIQPTTVSPSGSSHVIVELDIPASGRLVLTAGGAGPEGPVGPPGPSGASNTKKLLFTPTSGTLFVMEHGLTTEDFVWSLWLTDANPILTTQPVNIAPSGTEHVIVELDIPMSGKLTMVAVLDGG